MEEYRPRRKRRFHSAGYLKSGFLYYGALLFVIARILQFIQLFQEAALRKEAGQRLPEDFTAGGIIGKVLVIALILWLYVLLLRQRKGKSRIAQSRRYFLMNLLAAAWGVVNFIAILIDIFVYPEFILILDALAAVAALVAPPVLLQFSDSRRVEPDDTIFLLIGVAGLAFTAVSLIIIAVVLRKSYTLWRLVPEILYRAAQGLFSAAALQRALDIRSSLPIYAPAAPAPAVPVKKAAAPRVTCPDCGCRVPVTLPNCPRCGRDVGDLPPD